MGQAALILALWLALLPGLRAADVAEAGPQSLTLSAVDDEPRLALDWYHGATLTPALILVVPGFAQHKGTRTMRFIAGCLTPSADVMVLDLRGTGASHGFYSFGQDEPKDVQAALKLAQAHYARVDLLGFSLGAYIALRSAAEGPLRPRACLLVSLPTRVEEVVSSGGVFSFLFKGMGHHERLAVEPEADIFFRWGPVFGPKPRATDLAPALEAPTHLLCGGQDELVYPALTRKVWQALPAPATFTVWPDGRHAEQMALLHPRAFAAWVAQARAWSGGKAEDPFASIPLDTP